MAPRFLSLVVFLLPVAAHAGVVRGRVTTPLGVPVPGARVQLIRLTGGTQSVGDAIAGVDGSYEIRSGYSGRFLLLTSPSIVSQRFDPQVGEPFYSGVNDLLRFDVALQPTRIEAQSSEVATLFRTPLAQLAAAPAQVLAPDLQPQVDVVPEVAALPGAIVVERGQTGTPATLYLRGADPAATQVTLEGVPIEDLGGGFDLATLGTTGLASGNRSPALELLPGPVARLDAEAGELALHSARATTTRRALTYTGDAGPLDSYRNEAVLSASPRRADLQAAFSRFDTANEDSPYHLSTISANLGYHISGGTSLRGTARRDVSASAFTPPVELFGLGPTGRLSSQNLYAVLAFETETAGNWLNSLSFGLVRKRAELAMFSAPLTGAMVTVTGANGYRASGAALLPIEPARQDTVTDRDVYTLTSAKPFKPYVQVGGTFRFEDERGALLTSALRQTVERHHFEGTLSVQGEVKHRLFYEASGFLDGSTLLGPVGGPRAGLSYAAVQPGTRRFRGTVLHATAATGTREPSLAEQAAVSKPAAPHARTLALTADQTILPRKLSLRATYFHSQYAHQFEPLSLTLLSQTLAYRAQGLEATLAYDPAPRLALTGGYTYLAALTERSAATPVFNPAYPTFALGALTALPGARPFHRPPNSGFATASYTGRFVSASLRATVAGRSDDSTKLQQSPTLLLPNRNLSPGYAALDANASYVVTRRITAFTELTNLFNSRHIAPIGYTSTAFLIRTGLRIRLGGE